LSASRHQRSPKASMPHAAEDHVGSGDPGVPLSAGHDSGMVELRRGRGPRGRRPTDEVENGPTAVMAVTLSEAARARTARGWRRPERASSRGGPDTLHGASVGSCNSLASGRGLHHRRRSPPVPPPPPPADASPAVADNMARPGPWSVGFDRTELWHHRGDPPRPSHCRCRGSRSLTPPPAAGSPRLVYVVLHLVGVLDGDACTHPCPSLHDRAVAVAATALHRRRADFDPDRDLGVPTPPPRT